MNSDMMFMWYHGGRKVSSATIHRSGKITKSTLAVPGVSDGAETAQVVFVGGVVSVPGDDVQRGVVQLGDPHRAAPLDVHLGGGVDLLVGGDRGQEVPRVGQAVGAD